jgi:hypothetical protein
MPIVVYAPALALNQGNFNLNELKKSNYYFFSVTGINTFAAVTVIFVVCIFYTSIVSFHI